MSAFLYTVLIETYWNVKRKAVEYVDAVVKVLIETYWNVKYTAPDSASTLPLCINRNILECKDYCFLSTLFRALVLIETYWNVKFSGTAESYIHSCVLIETYWNVKCEYQFQFGGYLGINRNILECKALSFVISILSYPGINRNILECKVLF